jgi:hypothetical protein
MKEITFGFLLSLPTIGIPVTVTNAQTKESMTDPLQLFLYLNKIGYDQMYFKAKCVY